MKEEETFSRMPMHSLIAPPFKTEDSNHSSLMTPTLLQNVGENSGEAEESDGYRTTGRDGGGLILKSPLKKKLA